MAQTKLPTNPPTTLREYLQQTEDAISKGNLDDALTRCQNVLGQYADSLEAQRLLGEVYLAQGKLDEAQQSFDWVLTNDPENVLVYCDRALVSENLSDFDTALDCYQQAYELSRGNSQIREEFNKLSARAGQQGFMFSRAGLARLYMRGDLLTQSIQEWEAVLAITPDRLDARVGLLETLWRDGLYERAEQLARQVLLDVPGCLKALLLLAYIVSSRDLRQAQELLKRAEALDPDLQIAQELFSDQLASQSNTNEPFLSLLQRSPVTLTLPGQEAALEQLARQSSSPSHPSWPGVDVPQQSTSSPSHPSWPGLDAPQQSTSSPSHPSWPGLQTSQEPQRNSSPSWPGVDAPQQSTPSPSHPSWPGLQFESEGPQHPTQSSAPSQPESTGSTGGASSTWGWPGSDSTPAEPGQPDVNTMLNEARKYLSPDFNADESDPNATPWIHSELPPEGRQEPAASNEPQGTNAAGISENPFAFMPPPSSPGNPTSGLWSAPPADGSGPSAPPPWLGMLSQDDRQLMSGMGVAPQENPEASALAEPQVTPEVEQVEQPEVKQSTPEAQAKPASAPELPSTLGSDEDDDDDSFGPAWLKSIGAASMEYSREMPAIPARPQPTPVEPPKPEEPAIEAPAPQESASSESQDLFAQPAPSQPDAPFSDPSDPWAFPGNLSSQPGDPNGMPEWANQLLSSSGSAPQEQQAAPSWLDQLSHSSSAQPMPEQPVPEPAVPDQEQESERSVVASLEDLEKSLYSQGFVPLEPNSLSSLVQGQGVAEETREEFPQPQQEPPRFSPEIVPSSPSSEPDFLQELQDWRSRQETQEPSLSSALAALTGISSQPQTEEPAQPEQPEWAAMLGAAPATEPAARSEQPSWLAPQGTAEQQEQPSWLASPVPPTPPEQPSWLSSPMAPAQPEQPSWVSALSAVPASLQPPTEQRPIPTPPAQPFMPSEQPAAELELTHKAPPPAAKSNPFLEDNLETTMKRPAIRLQPVQRNTVKEPPTARNHSVERQPSAGEGHNGAQGRLLKGYQHQLVGDYDDAMQEYRVLIRTAPDLLGEVVSNLRALLKLAPNYSAGYRVLGDAYMRQGEYLQAMEAYNKALTMAKKAKS